MTGAPKRKGDRAEREACVAIHDWTGYPARRKLGAGRHDDVGDIDGVPNSTIQVCDWVDLARAVREKPRDAETQRINSGDLFAASFIRLRGGDFRVVLTVEQWATLTREALA